MITRGFLEDTIVTRGFGEGIDVESIKGGGGQRIVTKKAFDDDNDMIELLACILPVIWS